MCYVGLGWSRGPRYLPSSSRHVVAPVALLDVGSCTDPFSRYDFTIESFAIDLLPAEQALEEIGGRVLQGDFFEVPLVEAAAGSSCDTAGDLEDAKEPDVSDVDAPVADVAAPENKTGAEASSSSSGSDGKQRLVIDGDGKLQGIVAGAFDVVVMSLVLSYVDTAERRIEMVRKARRCLREDRGLLFIAEVGSALADVSWYKGDATMDWTRSIEKLGFRIVNFEDKVQEHRPYREQKVYQWVFETVPVPADGGASAKPLKTPKEMPWSR